MADDDQERLLERLAELEEQIAEFTDSPDPVARRQLSDALYARGETLHELGRYADAVLAWDALVDESAPENVRPEGDIVALALMHKALAQEALGEKQLLIETADRLLERCTADSNTHRRASFLALMWKSYAMADEELDAVIPVAQELVRRFGESQRPMVRREVMAALARSGIAHLLARRTDAAIDVSEQMIRQLLGAPEESLATEAGLALSYAPSLGALSDAGVRLEWLAFMLINALNRLIKLRFNRPGLRWGRPHWPDARRRIQATIALERAVLAALGDDPDPEFQRIAAMARLACASSRVAAGELRAGYREVEAILNRPDAASIQVLQRMAAGFRSRADLPGQLSAITLLHSRAEALGEGDDRIAQIAYDDSVAPLLAETTRLPVRWLARLMRPRP